MAYSIAPATKAALAQATALWPDRSRASDGTIGDSAHAARRSWHNPSRPDGTPDPNGVVYAFDLTHDPTHGCDAHALVRAAVARRDPRVLEAISMRRIWTKKRAAEGWRPYSGSNPHDKHAHVSVDPDHAHNIDPWWAAEEDDVTKEELQDALREVLNDAIGPGFTNWEQTVEGTLAAIRKTYDETNTDAAKTHAALTELKKAVDALNTGGTGGFTLAQIATAVADELAERAQA
jgi:hypothetical protein